MRGEGHDASEDGCGRGRPLAVCALALRGRGGAGTAELGGGVSNCLRAARGGADKAAVLEERDGDGGGTVLAARYLTPRECERLQGLPDDYTLVPWRRGLAADAPRYRAIGNGMAVPCLAWLLSRLAAGLAAGSDSGRRRRLGKNLTRGGRAWLVNI